MKKTLLSAVVLLFACLLNATPSVTITVGQVTPTTITCSFVKNADCATYYIVAAEPQSIEPYVGSFMGGATLEETVEMWGVAYTANDTYTWIEMNPNTMYVIYVTAKDASGNRVLCTDTAYTPKGGGSGPSVVTVSVTDVTSVGATTTVTPNDQTMMFKDLVVEAWVYDSIHSYYEAIDAQTADEMTYDSMLRFLQEDIMEYYETDQWVWVTLDPNTDYILMAVGMNADSVWGDMAMTSFTTLAGSAVENVELNTISVYPNPASEYILVNGVDAGETIAIIDIRGNKKLHLLMHAFRLLVLFLAYISYVQKHL